MTLERSLWLGIRLAGFYFVYLAVESLIALMGITLLAMQTRGPSQAASVYLIAVLKTSAYSFAGWYLLKDGSHVHRLLNADPEPTESGKNEIGSLPDDEST